MAEYEHYRLSRREPDVDLVIYPDRVEIECNCGGQKATISGDEIYILINRLRDVF